MVRQKTKSSRKRCRNFGFWLVAWTAAATNLPWRLRLYASLGKGKIEEVSLCTHPQDKD